MARGRIETHLDNLSHVVLADESITVSERDFACAVDLALPLSLSQIVVDVCEVEKLGFPIDLVCVVSARQVGECGSRWPTVTSWMARRQLQAAIFQGLIRGGVQGCQIAEWPTCKDIPAPILVGALNHGIVGRPVGTVDAGLDTQTDQPQQARTGPVAAATAHKKRVPIHWDGIRQTSDGERLA
jgi:hypothetical protein